MIESVRIFQCLSPDIMVKGIDDDIIRGRFQEGLEDELSISWVRQLLRSYMQPIPPYVIPEGGNLTVIRHL